MKHAQFSAEGLPVAFYSEDIHGPILIDGAPNPDCLIPAGTVQITEDQWLDFITNGGLRRWDGSEVVEYVPPAPLPQTPLSVSDRQFFQGLAIRGEIPEEEALDAVGPGIIPARLLTLIEQLPSEAQFAAKMLIRGATVFERSNPLAGIIGILLGWDAEALDEFWTFAATL